MDTCMNKDIKAKEWSRERDFAEHRFGEQNCNRKVVKK